MCEVRIGQGKWLGDNNTDALIFCLKEGTRMEIQITSRHEKASASLQETIAEEFGKLERYYDKITSCHVIIDSERGMDILEVVLTLAGHTVTAAAKAANIGKALDEAFMKVERQLEKISGKRKNHKNHNPARNSV
jgi:putative sigma-54 modulation protein